MGSRQKAESRKQNHIPAVFLRKRQSTSQGLGWIPLSRGDVKENSHLLNGPQPDQLTMRACG